MLLTQAEPIKTHVTHAQKIESSHQLSPTPLLYQSDKKVGFFQNGAGTKKTL